MDNKITDKFNRYIRLRDCKGLHGIGICISCSKPIRFEDCDAGHFISRGAGYTTRWHEDNVHAQCRDCNRYKDGNIDNYREGLLSRIGSKRIKAIEALRHQSLKLSRGEKQELYSIYEKKVKLWEK